jgi:prepilin-type N-terminal cleavage/methylation domain-containing protein
MNTNNPLPKTTTNGFPNRTFHRTAAACRAFTLIELLVVIAIIAILAGLGFAGVSGAFKTARKAEVRAMANQIKLGITAYYSEYGTYPSNQRTDTAFLTMMTGGTNGNRRGVRFLEVPGKFTNSSGIVTPARFYSSGQSNYTLILDTNYDGRIRLPGQSQDTGGNIAVYVTDPDSPTKYIGTWENIISKSEAR